MDRLQQQRSSGGKGDRAQARRTDCVAGNMRIVLFVFWCAAAVVLVLVYASWSSKFLFFFFFVLPSKRRRSGII